MIIVSPEVYMVLVLAANGAWVWFTVALGRVIGDLFWSPNTGLMYTLQQLLGW